MSDDELPVALREAGPPWLHLFPGSAEDLGGRARAWQRSGPVCRVLRGSRMRTEQGLFDELAAALQFPWYFGDSWAAVKDCLTDLDWLPGAGYLLLVRDAEQVLLDEPADRTAALLRTLEAAAAEWAEPVALGEWWDRPAVPFHVVLQTAPAGAAELRGRLGRDLPPL